MNQKRSYKSKSSNCFDDCGQDILEQYENMLKEANSILSDLKKTLSKKKRRVIEKYEECLNKYGAEGGNVPFIIMHEEERGVTKEIALSEDELMVLKTAVLFNRGVINLFSRTEIIKSLMSNGLVVIGSNKEEGGVIPYSEGLLVVDKMVRHILLSKKPEGFNRFMGWGWGNIM